MHQLDLLPRFDVHATTDHDIYLPWHHSALSLVFHLPLGICRQSQPRGTIEALVAENGSQCYTRSFHLLVLCNILWQHTIFAAQLALQCRLHSMSLGERDQTPSESGSDTWIDVALHIAAAIHAR